MAKRGLHGSFHVRMPALEAFAQVTIESLSAGSTLSHETSPYRCLKLRFIGNMAS